MAKATAAEKRAIWIDRMSDLMRAERWTEMREWMGSEEVHKLGRSAGWQDSCNWFDTYDKITPWNNEGDKWIAIQALIWFAREV